MFTSDFIYIYKLQLSFIAFCLILFIYNYFWEDLPETFWSKKWFALVRFLEKYFGDIWGQYVAIVLVSCVFAFFFNIAVDTLISHITGPELTEITDIWQLMRIKHYLQKSGNSYTGIDRAGSRMRKRLLAVIKHKGVIKGEDLVTLRNFVCWIEGPNTFRAKNVTKKASWDSWDKWDNHFVTKKV